MKEVNLENTFAKKLGMRTTAKRLFDEIRGEKKSNSKLSGCRIYEQVICSGICFPKT